jgi:hypothetical protein
MNGFVNGLGWRSGTLLASAAGSVLAGLSLSPVPALAKPVVYKNSVTYTVPFQPAYGSVVYSSPAASGVAVQSGGVSLTVTNPSVIHYPSYPVYPQAVYLGYPQTVYPGYPNSTVIVKPSSGRPIRNVNNSVLINPTVINGTIRNSTLINPTIVPAPTQIVQPAPVIESNGNPTITFPPIYQYPPASSTIVIQTVERR